MTERRGSSGLPRAAALAGILAILAGCGSSEGPAAASSSGAISVSPTASGARPSPAVSLPTTPTPGFTTQGPPWRPRPSQLFQIQLSGKLDLSVDAQIYEFDAEETPSSALESLHAGGGDRHFFCYIDAGSWESYRPDAAAFPKSVLGKVMEGWPDERWLDIRQIELLAPILRARLDVCKSKGFDGVDFDNVDGWANPTGFALSGADQLRFNRWLAAEAHRRGLFVMLKNDGEQAADLVADFDGAVVEQCVQYEECGLYRPFVDADKAVLDIEYSVPQKDFCAARVVYGIDTILKHESLDAYRLGCPG